MNTVCAPACDSGGGFAIHRLGYVRHWLVAGPHVTPYAGPPAAENDLRRQALDHRIVSPPAAAALNAPGPFGQTWRLDYPGGNYFVEHSTFHHQLVLIDSYAITQIHAAQDCLIDARLWAAGTVDLWVNATHLTRLEVARYMYPDCQPVKLALHRGVNTIDVRLQCLGVRDTRTLFGLQLHNTAGLSVTLPGCASLVAVAEWLDEVRTDGRAAVASARPAPQAGCVCFPDGSTEPWPAGSATVSLGSRRPFQLSVKVVAERQSLHRALEIPANRQAGGPLPSPDRPATRLKFIAASCGPREMANRLLARRLLGRHEATDAADFAAAITTIDRRQDCADFALATLLRLEFLGLATADESVEIRRAALAFRYWSDEPGNDAMCFWSENHSLLFHGCQLLAGQLYPAELFTTSGRTGQAQAALAIPRCREWLAGTDARGFDEFNSSAYMPLTVAAMLNLVDFAGDADLSRRAAALIDRVYHDLAIHAFDGIVVSPQGRVYRGVLYPEESGTQALLSQATAAAPPEFASLLTRCQPGQLAEWTGAWLVFPASSPHYRPPAHLDELMRTPITRRYRQAGVEIVLHKTPAYLLTSVSLPSTGTTAQDNTGRLRPGQAGYQQHLWQATLAANCHVFVNHPGCSFDQSQSRPGYWFGNGVLPRLCLREGILQAVYDIPDGSNPCLTRTAREWSWPPGAESPPFDLHPIPFTHVHWPSDAFDRQITRDHWLFGQKNAGCIAVWCSQPLQPHHDVLTGREFRAWAYRCAWVVICGSLAAHGSLAAFMQSALSRHPEFDPHTLSLMMPDTAQCALKPQGDTN